MFFSIQRKLSGNYILDYKDAIFQLQHELNNTSDINSIPFDLLIRPFNFYKENFEDIKYAAKACVPVLIGLINETTEDTNNKFIINDTKRTLELLGKYLDDENFIISDHEDVVELFRLHYKFEKYIEEAQYSTKINSFVQQFEKSYGSNINLKFNPNSIEERIKYYKEVIQAISTSKNCVYNIIRIHGDKLIENIENTISSLLPSDQNYLLHGLDAFPNNQKIIEFYEKFIVKNNANWIGNETKKYLNRVKSGIKTNGWEV